jgi:hypothetical protein
MRSAIDELQRLDEIVTVLIHLRLLHQCHVVQGDASEATLCIILSKIRPLFVKPLQTWRKVCRKGLRNWLSHQTPLSPGTDRYKSYARVLLVVFSWMCCRLALTRQLLFPIILNLPLRPKIFHNVESCCRYMNFSVFSTT